ncbi:MAG: hypothetical protein ABIV51_14265 [Saprospiraceae bacterium]
MLIIGYVHFEDIASGLWGIIGLDDSHWEIVNFPDQLKYQGIKVQVRLKVDPNSESIYMWGQPAWITGFERL